jgi:hypothetical protein
MLWKRRALVKLETMRCRFGPISTRKSLEGSTAEYRQSGNAKGRGGMHTDTHSHTATMFYRGPNESRPASQRLKGKKSETGSCLYEVRQTPPLSPHHHLRTLQRLPRHPCCFSNSRAASRRPHLRSHPSNGPGAVVLVLRYGFNRDGHGSVGCSWPQGADVYVAHRTGRRRAAYECSIRDPDTSRPLRNGARV